LTRYLITHRSLPDLTTRAIHDSDLAQLKTQQELAAAWMTRVLDFKSENVHVLHSIEDAVRVVRSLNEEPVDVLVTGSLHLVGGVIEVAGLSNIAL
jgi:folylpolyglutamate synthase